MKISRKREFAILIVSIIIFAPIASARGVAELPYMIPNLSPVVRARDLARRLTLQERASELVNGGRG